jgi:hypothetical protein
MVNSIRQIRDRGAEPRGGQVIPRVTNMQLGDRDKLSTQIRDYDTCFAEFLKPSGNGQKILQAILLREAFRLFALRSPSGQAPGSPRPTPALALAWPSRTQMPSVNSGSHSLWHWGCSCLRKSALRGVPPLTALTQISVHHHTVSASRSPGATGTRSGPK